MITSEFILNILNLTLVDNDETELLKSQIPFLTIRKLEHKGIGLYIYFEKQPQIHRYCTNLKDTPLTGLEIKNEKENVLADAIVYIKDGLLDYIEIFNKNGNDYPIIELTNYEMYQTWLDESCRKSITKV